MSAGLPGLPAIPGGRPPGLRGPSQRPLQPQTRPRDRGRDRGLQGRGSTVIHIIKSPVGRK